MKHGNPDIPLVKVTLKAGRHRTQKQCDWCEATGDFVVEHPGGTLCRDRDIQRCIMTARLAEHDARMRKLFA